MAKRCTKCNNRLILETETHRRVCPNCNPPNEISSKVDNPVVQEPLSGVQRFFAIILVIIVIMFDVGLLTLQISGLVTAFNLKDRGIITIATVLESKDVFHRDKYSTTSHDHTISYDGYTQYISLDTLHKANSTIAVIYDQKNPTVVWQGHNTLSAWGLWRLHFFKDDHVVGPILLTCLLLFINLIAGICALAIKKRRGDCDVVSEKKK